MCIPFCQCWLKAENDRSPIRSLQIKVSDKREFTVTRTLALQREPLVNEPMRYEVVYSPLDGGEEIRLLLKQWQYNPLEKGTRHAEHAG